MKTLIELYDERPIENVLGTEMFQPEETVILCPPEVHAGKLKASLDHYFQHRNCPVKVTVIPVSLLDVKKIEKQLRNILETRKDCAIDISGGTDASLFAAGAVSGDMAVYTYSRKRNKFFEIQNAPFAKDLPCDIRLDAESCFLMAGGKLLPGREDNEKLKNMQPWIDSLFQVFRRYRRMWRQQIGYMQSVSSSEPGVLDVCAPYTASVDRGNVTASKDFLYALERADLIDDLRFREDKILFRFPNEMIRFWLRDIGSVLELQVYRAALEAGVFDDVVLSAVVNWEGGNTQRDFVTNEIDVVTVRGVQPMFISCKTSEVRTEALNELAVLRGRFGGAGSRAMIVTSAPSSKSRVLMRKRAAELNIEVVEWDDLPLDRLVERLKSGIQK